MAAARTQASPRPRPAAALSPAVVPAPFPLDGPHRWLDERPDAVLDRVLRALGADPATALHADGPPSSDGAPSAVVVSHPLGFPSDAAPWRAWCDKRKIPLVEDARHALFAWTPAGPVGSIGDAAVFSLRETLGLPGTVVAGAISEELPQDSGRRAVLVARLLPRCADPGAQGRRRGHFAALADLLDPDPRFGSPPPGAAPLVFPLPGGVRLPVHQGLDPADVERLAVGHGATLPPPRVEPIATLEEAEPMWTALEERAGNLFGTFAWARTWWEHYGDGRQLHLFAVRDDAGEAIALLPLYRASKRPLDVIRLLGHGPADRLAPLCAPEHRPAAARALRHVLDDLRPDVFVADEVPVEEGWGGLAGGRTVTRSPSPVLFAGGRTWDEFLAARSRNFRDQARRRERTLAKQHEIAFRLTTTPEELERDFATLVELHERRWGAESDAFAGERRAFHRDFALRALERGWLRLWTLDADGRAVAAWLGFRYDGAEWFYQSGRDPDWDKKSVGFVLLVHTVRSALDDGMAEYRLLRGGEEYKARFSTYDAGLETLAVARTPAGRAAAAGSAAVRAMPPHLRARLKRIAG